MGGSVPGSVVLDTVIGLVFVFLTASLICTGVLEYVSNKQNKRGEYLLRGLREMLDLPLATPGAPTSQGDAAADGKLGLADSRARRQGLQRLAQQGLELRDALPAAEPGSLTPAVPLADLVLSHPLVAPLHRPARPGKPGGRMHRASYLSSRTFAASLIDLLAPNGASRTSVAELEQYIGKLDIVVPARSTLLALLRSAGSSVQAFQASLEAWYDEQMGRVSGWYRRWAQWRLLLLGLLLALVVNVDSLQLARALFRDQPVRTAVVAQALSAQGCPAAGQARTDCLDSQRSVLQKLSLPLGWDLAQSGGSCRAYTGTTCGWHVARWVPFYWHAATSHGARGVLLKLVGWLLTGLAVSLGAPFWFDALGKLGSLRTAGRRPGENASYQAPRATH